MTSGPTSDTYLGNHLHNHPDAYWCPDCHRFTQDCIHLVPALSNALFRHARTCDGAHHGYTANAFHDKTTAIVAINGNWIENPDSFVCTAANTRNITERVSLRRAHNLQPETRMLSALSLLSFPMTPISTTSPYTTSNLSTSLYGLSRTVFFKPVKPYGSAGVQILRSRWQLLPSGDVRR
jgi:hypothetical protein